MITRDPQKEFQVNPLTAIVPFHGDFATLSNNLEPLEIRFQELDTLLKDADGLASYSEQVIKKLQSELDMLRAILDWAGKGMAS